MANIFSYDDIKRFMLWGVLVAFILGMACGYFWAMNAGERHASFEKNRMSISEPTPESRLLDENAGEWFCEENFKPFSVGDKVVLTVPASIDMAWVCDDDGNNFYIVHRLDGGRAFENKRVIGGQK